MIKVTEKPSEKPREFGKKSQGKGAHLPAEMMGIVFLLAAAMLALSLASFSPTDPVLKTAGRASVNWVGLVGAHMANSLFHALGLSAFVLVAVLLYAARVAFSRGGLPLSKAKLLSYFALMVLGTVLFQILLKGQLLLGHAPGGMLGEYAGGLMLSLLSLTGSLLVVFSGVTLGFMGAVGFSPVTTYRVVEKWAKRISKTLKKNLTPLYRFLGKLFLALGKKSARQLSLAGQRTLRALRVRPARKSRGKRAVQEASGAAAALVGDPYLAAMLSQGEHGAEPAVIVAASDGSLQEPFEVRPAAPYKPEIVIPRIMEKPDEPRDEPRSDPQQVDYRNFQLPDLSLLDLQEQPATEINPDLLHEYARRLEQKLADYKVGGRVNKIMPGPVVTMYEFSPAPGIKVSTIASLSNDLALALEAMSVRIVAPIPGRSVVGIEVANKTRQTVYAREIIGSNAFLRSRSKLTLAFGKDIEGNPTAYDLNKMPHLLVAGATGTGKSVALNAMITSILFRATPQDVRFILIDPKVLELSLYEDIPHLLLPVVTDPRKAQAALHWTIVEMERRIRVLHRAGVRDLDGYNRKVLKLEEEKKCEDEAEKKFLCLDHTQEPEAEPVQAELGFEPPHDNDAVLTYAEEIDDAPLEMEPEPAPEDKVALKPLPHIVIVIDELADLMIASKHEVEKTIVRIAQKARAAGIHLIVATQRPSVDVITGLIKANLPARISCKVASKTDSRTILDQNGAETLLGCGDMLFHPPTSSNIIRIHGALITEEEITRVVTHLKSQANPVYDESILAQAEAAAAEDAEEQIEEGQDEMYDMSIQVVAEAGYASTSMVQRKLRIGYNRAARLVERMEREGIVGPPDGSKPREVLVQSPPSS